MKNGRWNYKVGGSLQGFIPLLILLAVFGGVSIWLYSSNNGASLFTTFFTAIILVLMACSIYRCKFVKVLIGENGFYHQTKPGNGKYFAYHEITEAWESSAKNQNGTVVNYFSYRTIDGSVTKFLFLANEYDGIEYLLMHINGDDSKQEEEDTNGY